LITAVNEPDRSSDFLDVDAWGGFVGEDEAPDGVFLMSEGKE